MDRPKKTTYSYCGYCAQMKSGRYLKTDELVHWYICEEEEYDEDKQELIEHTFGVFHEGGKTKIRKENIANNLMVAGGATILVVGGIETGKVLLSKTGKEVSKLTAQHLIDSIEYSDYIVMDDDGGLLDDIVDSIVSAWGSWFGDE